MWRDPLDELIEDLERTLPPASRPTGLPSSELVIGCQMLIVAIMYGHPEDIARAEQDPRVKAWTESLERNRSLDDAHEQPDGRGEEPKRG